MSYGTLAGGDTYFATRLHESAWTAAGDADQTAALLEASRAINALAYLGEKHTVYELLLANPFATADEIKTASAAQPDQFPRDNDEEVPEDIENATYELAHALLDGRDAEAEIENLAVSSHGLQSARISYDRAAVPPDHIANGIVSWQAWRFLLPYLSENRGFTVSRV